MRLVRELLIADAEPAVAQADVVGRAGRYLEVLVGGLALRGGALLLRAPERGLECVASTVGAVAKDLLVAVEGRVGTLVRRTVEERRAFLIRRGTDDPLLACLQEGDPTIAAVAMVPLVDRTTTGVLVLAGDEKTLAPDVVRTLTPALRLVAILVSGHRDGVIPTAPADGLLESVRAERDENARTIQQLATRVGELETALAVAREAIITAPGDGSVEPALTPRAIAVAAAANVDAAEALIADVGGRAEPPVLVVIDHAGDWSAEPIPGHRVIAMTPAAAVPEALAEHEPARLIVNLLAAGGLAQLAALRRRGVTTPAIGMLREADGTRIVGLGLVEAVEPHASPEALVAAVQNTAPRGARVFAAGRDADALMKMRQVLAREGLSVSMALDTKQIEELVAMVRPQVMVVDLALPGAEGYELVLRAAAMTPPPGLVVMMSDVDPLPALSKKLHDRLASGAGIAATQWLALAASHAIEPKRRKTPSASATPATPS